MAAEELESFGLSTTVADARFAKPLDHELIRSLASQHDVLLSVEEGVAGGFGSHVLQLLTTRGCLDGSAATGIKVRNLVMPDIYVDQMNPKTMYADAGLDKKGIVTTVFEALGRDLPAAKSDRRA